MSKIDVPQSPSTPLRHERPLRLWIVLIAIISLGLLASQPAPQVNPAQKPTPDEQLALAALHGDLPSLKSIWLANRFSPTFDDPRAILANPLRCAAAAGSLPAVNQILAWGADPDSPSPAGRTPLMCAAGASNSAAIGRALFERGANPLARDLRGHTAMSLAQSAHDANLISVLNNPPILTRNPR